MWDSQTDRDVCQLSMLDGDGLAFDRSRIYAPCICAYLRVASGLHVCATAARNTYNILHVRLIDITTIIEYANAHMLVDSTVSARPHQLVISPS